MLTVREAWSDTCGMTLVTSCVRVLNVLIVLRLHRRTALHTYTDAATYKNDLPFPVVLATRDTERKKKSSMMMILDKISRTSQVLLRQE